MRQTASIIALTAAVFLAGGSGATAQMAPMDHAGSPAPAEMQARHEARERQRAQDLRIILRLRPDQEAALTTLLAHAPRPPMERPEPSLEALTLPQRLDEMGQHESRMMAERQAHIEALKAFYAALSPEQRQVFDALMRLQGPHGAGGPHGMAGGMHGEHGSEGPHAWGGPRD